jgi:hypothetical protein
VALTSQDSWVWQMHADIPLEDETHEVLWRQLLRYLVSEVPQPLTARLSTDRVEPGQAVTITADVADSGYVRVNGADVWATIVDPAGGTQEVPLRWTVRRDGEYEASWTPTLNGLHELRIRAEQGGTLGEGTAYLRRATWVPSTRCGTYSDAAAVAEETGGRHTPSTLRPWPKRHVHREWTVISTANQGHARCCW